MTHKERILAFLAERRGLWFDDDEISRTLNIQPRQQVNALCRQLHDYGRIRREQRGTKYHSSALSQVESVAVSAVHESAPAPFVKPEQPLTAVQFEALATQVMAAHYKSPLAQGRVPGVPKRFDLVSPDQQIVGDAKFYTLVKGKGLPPAKFSVIAEHVWLLERTTATHRFLVFGNDRRVPEQWLKRYGHLVRDVAFFFLTEAGDLERLQ